MEIEQRMLFPPTLKAGQRVWTIRGYHNHGPLEGPKVDIAPNQGGTIAGTHKPYQTIDRLLYAVAWDRGGLSKHYANELFCIGRFGNRTDFEAAIKVISSVDVTVGPAGGFRSARFEVEYDGQHQAAVVENRDFWIECMEPLVRISGCRINTTRLPKKR